MHKIDRDTLHGLVCCLVFFFHASSAAAQEINPQVRALVHPTLPLSERVYITNWDIVNVRDDATDNINFNLGLGVKGKTWWLDSMVQRQYSMRSNQWFLDFRFQTATSKRSKIWLQVSPYLGRKAVYQFTRWDHAFGKFAIGAESENIFQEGLDSLGIGPTLSFPPLRVKGVRTIPTITYQYRGKEPAFVRLYVVIPIQLK